MSRHEELLAGRVLPWAMAEDTVRGVAEIGSRTHAQPDEWADMDLLLLVRGRDRYVGSDDWIAEIGDYWLAVRHPGPFEDLPVRQVLFDGALDFDIVPIEAGTLQQRLEDPGVAFALGGGYQGGFQILVDKDGELTAVENGPSPSPGRLEQITSEQYEFLVNDFLFQVVWAAKHLRRGELWAAKDDVDCYMKANLVRLIEAEALTRTDGAGVRTGARHIEEWTTSVILDRLPAIFPGYDRREVASALLAQLELFGEIGRVVAAAMGWSYPNHAHDRVRSWARDCLVPLTRPSPSQGS